MAYVFDAIDISIFDFHLVLDPLSNGASINNNYRFLVDPVLYNQQYRSETVVQSANFKLSPLKWRSLNYHHYWKYYQTIWPTYGSYDFWKLQMPFIGHSTLQLTLDTHSPNFQGTIDSTTFVTGMGWSTNVDINLRGQMTPADVSQFVGRLSKKGTPMFVVNGKPKIMPELFESLGDSIHQELYASQIVPLLRLRRYIVMTLSSYTGPVAPYLGSFKRIPAGDRALFHSMLTGVTVGFAEVIDRENQRNQFLLTQFKGRPDFAITYFDYGGTLLFMQQTALGAMQQGRVPSSKMKCHSRNIRNYLLTTLDLYHFRRDSKTAANANPKVKTMRADAMTTLAEIPKRYNNQFCQSFHSNYGPLISS